MMAPDNEWDYAGFGRETFDAYFDGKRRLTSATTDQEAPQRHTVAVVSSLAPAPVSAPMSGPFATDPVDSQMYGSAANAYGRTGSATAKPKRAGASVGDSRGLPPWSLDRDLVSSPRPSSASPKRSVCPFAIDLD